MPDKSDGSKSSSTLTRSPVRAAEFPADSRFVPANRLAYGSGAKALGLQFGNLVSFRTGEMRVWWHGNIVSLFDNKRISNPLTMLHLAPEFTAVPQPYCG